MDAFSDQNKYMWLLNMHVNDAIVMFVFFILDNDAGCVIIILPQHRFIISPFIIKAGLFHNFSLQAL